MRCTRRVVHYRFLIIETMLYFILLVVGLLIGAIFLVVLLIGDKKEARLVAQKIALQEQIKQASQQMEGAWPPPLSASAMPDLSQPAPPPKSTTTRETTRKIIRTYSLLSNYAIGAVILAFIIYSCFPRCNFGWVLLATALAVLAVWGVITKFRESGNQLIARNYSRNCRLANHATHLTSSSPFSGIVALSVPELTQQN